MISETKQRLKYVVTDYVTTNLAFFAFNIIRYYMLDLNDMFEGLWQFMADRSLIVEQIVIPFALLGLYWLSGFYNKPFMRSRVMDVITTLFSSFVATALLFVVMLSNDMVPRRRINLLMLLALFSLLFLFVWLGRLIISNQERRRTLKRKWKFNTIIIGASQSALDLTHNLRRSLTLKGYNILGYRPIEGEECVVPERKIIKGDFETFLHEHDVSQLILVPQNHNEDTVLRLITELYPFNLPVKIVPDTLSLITSGIKLGDIYGEPFIDIMSPAMTESGKNLKRMLDVIVSAMALVTLALPMAVIALLVKLDSKGPVFYSQERIGYRQKPFNIYKFRSMATDAEKDGPRLSKEGDPRITRLGHYLRKYRIDELPQFFNVLKGDMSLVGPRPERAYFINKITEKEPYYAILHQVRPGITSWGMVKYGYASTIEEMVQRMRFDLIYLSNMSATVDIKILIHTVKTVLRGRGK